MVNTQNIDQSQISERNVRIVRQFYDLLRQKDLDTWIKLWDEHGKITIPYPPKGLGSTIEGRASILEAFRGFMGNFARFNSNITAIYPAIDSDAVCVEYSNDAVLMNGTVYTNDNIAVFIFRDGLISEYHDYFDPRRFQVVIDALPKS
jgi:uncharacterized protein